MSDIRFAKVVAALPPTVDPHTLYLVRTGSGFDLYCSDATGGVAHALNPSWPGAPLAYPKRTSAPKIVGDIGGTALGTATLTASRQLFVPLVVPRRVVLSGLRISVTTAVAGQANLGIYGNTVVAGNDAPGARLAQIASLLDTGTTGDKTGSFAASLTLEPGTLYWASLICSANPSLRALAAASIQPALGRAVNGTAVISHLYVAGSGTTLPNPAPTNLIEATTTLPAIYLIE